MLYSLPVNLVRQWCFCPRVVYYRELVPSASYSPDWVRQGERFHERESTLWSRRNLSRFALAEGRVRLNVAAASKTHMLHGVADMVIETIGSVHPVEFKLAESVQKRGGVLQLVAYGIILEDSLKKSCGFGFLTEGVNKILKVEIDEPRKREVHAIANKIRAMLEKGVKPDTPATIHQCTGCEYRNHCNDRA